jgi:hypothetical protein
MNATAQIYRQTAVRVVKENMRKAGKPACTVQGQSWKTFSKMRERDMIYMATGQILGVGVGGGG